MACIELLLQDTNCSAHQLDLLEGAEACGLQLRGNIDNILLYSNIGSASPRPEQSNKSHFPDFAEDVSQGKNNILALIEETIERDTRKRKSTLSSNGAKNLLWTSGNQALNQRPVSTIITVDADPRTDFSLGRYSGISVIINNLLGIAVGFFYFGWMSDLLAPRFGDESLRWAIYTGMGFYLLASVLLIGASRTLKKDWVD